MVNEKRLWNRLMKLSEIGKTKEGGVTRFSFTKEDFEAKDLVKSYMIEAGLVVREDEIGNIFGRKEGKNKEIVLIGSHIDTVLNGGFFDGALGVLSSIEVLQSMSEKKIELSHTVEVAVFVDEEGSRFSSGMLGSHAVSGALTKEHLELTDSEGKTFAEVLDENGYPSSDIFSANRINDQIKAYLEVHVEQGKFLEKNNSSVGVVTGIAGPLWLKFCITGKEGHAGSTPMNIRKDALVAASIIIQNIEKEASSTKNTVGTVGTMSIKPGGVNIIPGNVEFTLDLRDVDPKIRDSVESNIRNYAETVCHNRGIKLKIITLQNVPPVVCSEDLQRSIGNSMEELGLKIINLPSGAAHDANQISRLCPVGMIFIRSKNGMSHSPEELSTMEDCKDGANVLYLTLLKIAG